MAVRSYVDRLHLIEHPDLARVTQRALCGRQVFIVEEAQGLTRCRQCWPTGHLERDMHDIWDACADLDGRYNGTIRDERPLGSIFDG